MYYNDIFLVIQKSRVEIVKKSNKWWYSHNGLCTHFTDVIINSIAVQMNELRETNNKFCCT